MSRAAKDGPAPRPLPALGWTHRVLIAAAVAALLLLAWQVANLLLLVFGGVLIAVGLAALSERLGRFAGIPRPWAFGLTLLAIAAAIGVAVRLLAGRLAPQLDELVQRLPQTFGALRETLHDIGLGRVLPDLGELLGGSDSALAGLGRLASTSLGGLADALLVIAVAIYVAADPEPYRRGLLKLLPPGRRTRFADALAAAGEALTWWLLGRGIAMIGVGVLTGIGLWLVGVPYALSLGVIAGLLDFVPYIGPILAALPGILVAFSQSPTVALYAALVYLVVQQIEGMLLTPLIQRRTVSVQPAVLIVAVVAFGIVFGFAGVVFGAPLTVVAQIFVQRLYVDDWIESGSRAAEAPVVTADRPGAPE